MNTILSTVLLLQLWQQMSPNINEADFFNPNYDFYWDLTVTVMYESVQ